MNSPLALPLQNFDLVDDFAPTKFDDVTSEYKERGQDPVWSLSRKRVAAHEYRVMHGIQQKLTSRVTTRSQPRKRQTVSHSEVVERRFLELAIEWKYTRGPTSSLSELYLHPSYMQIVGMGKDAVPFLLREIQEDVDHWFHALQAILQVNPVSSEHEGNLKLMAEDWIQWARNNGWLDI